MTTSNASKSNLIILFLLVIISLTTTPAKAVRFYMHDRERRCFRFESEYDALILAHSTVSNGKGTAELSIEVRDTRKHVIFQSHHLASDTKTKFSFRTPKFDPTHVDRDIEEEEEEAYDYDPREMEGWFEACLTLSLDRTTHDPLSERAVTFWIKPEDYHMDQEHEAHDGDNKADDEQVVSIADSLQEMQTLLQKMVTDVVVLQHRERRLVDHSQHTSKRLVILSFISFFVLIFTSVLQFTHFKTYFKSKKLI